MQKAIISQYRAALKMLIDVINKCPDILWTDPAYENQYWRIVYHSLFYTHLYLHEGPDEFIPWRGHMDTYNYLGEVTSYDKPVVIKRV